ncbi:MAG: hypothetical protein H7226_08760, partial [Salinibacterium sp.]|nr:hypothetical protein [Salinibacterium sp.]
VPPSARSFPRRDIHQTDAAATSDIMDAAATSDIMHPAATSWCGAGSGRAPAIML